MNGELAQIVALITYGNKFLSASQSNAPELFPSNSTFQYVSDVAFKRETPKLGSARKQEVIASDTRTWFAGLRTAGNKKLGLALVQIHQELPQHIAVPFAGSSDWVIRATSGKATEVWRAKWLVKNQHHPQNRIWSVEYWGITNYPAQANFPKVDEAAKQLNDALHDAKTFSEKANLSFWGEWFTEALGLLSHPTPVIPHHPDLLPPDFQTLSSRQLLASACKAWVFGGMGSWNDVCFESASLRNDYDSVTARLYQAVVNAVGAVTNSNAA
jgi:hypothetical protein